MNKFLEKLKSHPLVSPNVSIEFFETPYRHAIIDNLLRDDIYDSMVRKFPEHIAKLGGKTAGVIADNEKLVYNANIYGMRPNDCADGFEFFVDPFWKNWVADLFGLLFNQHTAYSLHFHKGSKESPSNSGWSHKDLSICSAITEPEKEVKLTGIDCQYQDDSQSPTGKIARSVAMLYYMGNIDNPTLEDGGGTAIYDRYHTLDPLKTVLPINNRWFAFEICPTSYHGFVGAKFDRSSIVQWFHSSPAYIVHRNLEAFKRQYKNQNGLIFERWMPKMAAWEIEKDPHYKHYLGDKSLLEILSE
jgi:hypothetical protein